MSTNSPTIHGLEVIPRNRVFSEVAKQLQTRIVNKLKPGDMLPAERELAKRFGVSRGSIRDAIRSLEAVGILEPRQGIGTMVREVPADCVVGPVTGISLQKKKTISDLIDVRCIIEPALAHRAALHATPEQLAEMQSVLTRQKEKVFWGASSTDEDAAFHYTIALAANNSVMMKLVHVLMDLLRELRERSLQNEGRAQKSLAGHLRIFAAVKQGDGPAAEAAMRQHLSEVETIVMQSLE